MKEKSEVHYNYSYICCYISFIYGTLKDDTLRQRQNKDPLENGSDDTRYSKRIYNIMDNFLFSKKVTQAENKYNCSDGETNKIIQKIISKKRYDD